MSAVCDSMIAPAYARIHSDSPRAVPRLFSALLLALDLLLFAPRLFLFALATFIGKVSMQGVSLCLSHAYAVGLRL